MSEKVKKGRGVGKRIAALLLVICVLLSLLAIPASAAETSTYLYNGVELPDINTVWTDKTAYPYAVISQDNNDAWTRLYLLSGMAKCTSTDVSTSIVYYAKYLYGDGVWCFDADGCSGVVVANAGYSVRWTSADILNSDGTVYFAASEPIPVYSGTVEPAVYTSFDGQVIYIAEDEVCELMSTAVGYSSDVVLNAYINGALYGSYTMYYDSERSVHYHALEFVPDGAGTRTLTVEYLVDDVSVYTASAVINVTATGDSSGDSSGGSSEDSSGDSSGESSDVSDRLDSLETDVGEVLAAVTATSDQLNTLQEDVDAMPGEIVDGIGDLMDQQQEQADSSGNSAVDDLSGAVPDYSAQFVDALTNFAGAFSYEGTEAVLPIPSVTMPGVPGLIPETVIFDGEDLDFGDYIVMLPSGLLLLVQSLLTIALIVFCFKELYSTISYVLTLRRGSGGE